MIRVGFRPLGGTAWAGGRSYLQNLLFAVTSLPDRAISPVLVAASGSNTRDLACPGVEVFEMDGVLASDRVRRIGRLVQLATRRNPVDDRWLARARIDVLSHDTPAKNVPTIGWIPDLQHRRLAAMFSRRDWILRELATRELLRHARIVLLSSEAARADVLAAYDVDPHKLRVLRFVSQPRHVDPPAIAELVSRLAIPPRFVHLPNQLWKHKNHALVLAALREAPEVHVVATGSREDFRHPGMYDELLATARRLGVTDRFHHLGLVDVRDLFGLMHHAVAVVNPSRFEGWSTTVEEAKSIGKRVLVSDIAVHREQAPDRAMYFPVDDARRLASCLREVWATHDPDQDARAAAAAAAALPARTRAFGETYQRIVLDVA